MTVTPLCVEKGRGHKKTRRLNNELIELEASMKITDAKIASDVARFQERAKISLMLIEVEKLRAKRDLERAEIDRDVEDNRVMAMDLSGLDDFRVAYFHRQIQDIIERQAERQVRKEAAAQETKATAQAARVAELDEVANAVASEDAANAATAVGENAVVEAEVEPTKID